MSSIHIKRIYDPPAASDGYRVLVDRLWPRGIRKEDANVDLWMKEVSPSTELRQWFGHDPERWDQFCMRYRKELESHKDDLQMLRTQAKKGTLTLLFSAKDVEHNNALVLKTVLENKKR